MSDPKHDDSAALRAAMTAVDHAADGDSNDAEIDALRHALDLALRRWPELDNAGGPVERPAGIGGAAEAAGSGSPSQQIAAAASAEPATSADLVTLPHTGIQVPDPTLRVSSLRQLPAPDGVAYTATLRQGRTPVGTIHNEGMGGATSYHPAAGSPFGLRQLAAFVAASRTADGQPLSEEQLLEDWITEHEHAKEVAKATRLGRSPLRLRAPLDQQHFPDVIYTARHATAPKVTTAAQRTALIAELRRTPIGAGQWWQLWTGQRWEELTPPRAHRPEAGTC
jgi:hypothetical protein